MLAFHQLPLSLFETGLFVFHDANLLTYGLLFCFSLAAVTLFPARDNERLALHRVTGRHDVWAGRALALLHLTLVFLAAVTLTFLIVIVPGHTADTGWSAGYDHAIAIAQARPEGLEPVFYLAADPFLRRTFSPVGLCALQVALAVVVFWATGVLSTVVAQAARTKAAALLGMLTYLGAYRVAVFSALPAATLLTPQYHLLLSSHVPTDPSRVGPYVPIGVSLIVWCALLVVLWAVGSAQTDCMELD